MYRSFSSLQITSIFGVIPKAIFKMRRNEGEIGNMKYEIGFLQSLLLTLSYSTLIFHTPHFIFHISALSRCQSIDGVTPNQRFVVQPFVGGGELLVLITNN